MRVIIEGSVLDDKRTGVARFVRNIVSIWVEYFRGNQYLIIKRSFESAFPSNIVGINYAVVPWFKRRNIIWQQFIVPKFVNEIDADIYFAPNYTLPLLMKVPAVIAVHDLSFFHYREGSLLKNLFLKWLLKKSCNKAQAIIVPAYYIKDELIKCLGSMLSDKVYVINDACDNFFLIEDNQNHIEKVKEKYGIKGDYILNVGLIFNRRHPELALKVINRLVNEYKLDLTLVMIGGNRTLPYLDIDSFIREMALGSRVVLINYVSDDELRALYKGCSALIYLSDYEGFALPILEALSFRKPVVCSDINIFRELYFGACFFVDNRDEKQIADRIAEVIEKPISNENIERCISKYSWEKSGKMLMQIMERIVNR